MVIVALGVPGVPVICWASAAGPSDKHRTMLDDDRKLAILITMRSHNGRFRGAQRPAECGSSRPRLKQHYIAAYAFSAGRTKLRATALIAALMPALGSRAVHDIAKTRHCQDTTLPRHVSEVPAYAAKSFRQLRPRHDGRFHRLHRHRIGYRAADALFGKRIDRLHLEPGIFAARAIEHIDAERQIVAVEAPRPQHIEILGADAVPRGLDRTGVGELPHLHIGAAVAQHFDAFGSGARMARAIHHEVGAEAADDVAHGLDARFRRRDLLNVYSRFRAELAREL